MNPEPSRVPSTPPRSRPRRADRSWIVSIGGSLVWHAILVAIVITLLLRSRSTTTPSPPVSVKPGNGAAIAGNSAPRGDFAGVLELPDGPMSEMSMVPSGSAHAAEFDFDAMGLGDAWRVSPALPFDPNLFVIRDDVRFGPTGAWTANADVTYPLIARRQPSGTNDRGASSGNGA